MHSGGINYIIWPKGLIKRLWQTEMYYYIMGVYMTFSSSDIHDLYNKDQISKQDHDSHQQLSCTIYDFHHKHLSATSRPATCICPSPVPKILQSKYHQPVTKYAIYRYQLILLISSRSTCFVSLVERALS